MSAVSVVIPIYKNKPSLNELLSYKQCLNVLNKYPITIICPRSLKIDYYLMVANNSVKIIVEHFDDTFFSDVLSYNNLMLSKLFYNRFAKYEFILIYQLDAWVFKDELEYWCKLEYDFIGAPWFENFNDHKQGNLWFVGNGGFSLRRIKKFRKLLSYNGPIKRPGSLLPNKKRGLKVYIYFLFRCLGYKNNLSFLLKVNDQYEDFFWTSNFLDSWIKLKVAPIDIAYKFSFEKSPSYLYKLNDKKLPFGCHGWERYEPNKFWSKFINYYS